MLMTYIRDCLYLQKTTTKSNVRGTLYERKEKEGKGRKRNEKEGKWHVSLLYRVSLCHVSL